MDYNIHIMEYYYSIEESNQIVGIFATNDKLSSKDIETAPKGSIITEISVSKFLLLQRKLCKEE